MLGVVARDEKPTEDPLFVRDAAYVQGEKHNMHMLRETVCVYVHTYREASVCIQIGPPREDADEAAFTLATHTHTYAYTDRERERERERQHAHKQTYVCVGDVCVCVCVMCVCVI